MPSTNAVRHVLPDSTMLIGVEISRSIENKRILVIDSDEVTRTAIQFMLHDENETHELASVAEAIAKSDGRKVDLVMLGRAIVRDQGTGVFDEIAHGIPGAKVCIACCRFSERCSGLPPVWRCRCARQTAHRRIGAPQGGRGVLGRGPGFTHLGLLGL
jgi:hypothetical protein